MSQFIIEPSLWKLLPTCEVGVLLLCDLDNTEEGCQSHREEINVFLAEAAEEAWKYLTEPVLSQHQVVAVWREAFSKFKTKKGVRSSIEALLKRVEKGTGVASVNPLVDLYNGVSLRYALPCGMEDLDAIQGDLRLTVTGGGDPFFALGDEKISETLSGEVCYLDEAGAVCRFLNWRDGQRTMLMHKTRNAIAVMESVDPSRHEDLVTALDTLGAWVEKMEIGRVRTRVILNRENPTVKIKD
ncbi:MAG: phenylalanine--tRNA ligase beta subunit-related protein [Bacillota bacterium]|nr:phenylalanine--tRNA ligase beta subunit-related protein [Bacillota bacterium]MDW7677371.1 phenylalanine--tRNA ligase beta subunit-related protein [Bacillota bacterium]